MIRRPASTSWSTSSKPRASGDDPDGDDMRPLPVGKPRASGDDPPRLASIEHQAQ